MNKWGMIERALGVGVIHDNKVPTGLEYSLSVEWTSNWGANAFPFTLRGYAKNTSSGVGQHGGGVLGWAEDTASGQISLYGVEGKVQGHGASSTSYIGLLGSGEWIDSVAGNTTTNASSVYGVFGRTWIYNYDGVTPRMEGTAMSGLFQNPIGGNMAVGVMIQDITGHAIDVGLAIAGADTVALWLGSGADNTDAANGVTFGSSADTNLYRSAANTLKTDDNFVVGGGSVLVSGGTLTLGGVGGTLNENLTLDFDTTSNFVYLNSTSGANTIENALRIIMRDNTNLCFGTNDNATLNWETNDNSNLQLGLLCGHANYSGYFSIMERSDLENANRSPSGTSVDPVLRVYSADAAQATDYIEMYHDQTWGILHASLLQLKTGTGGRLSIFEDSQVVIQMSPNTTYEFFNIGLHESIGNALVYTHFDNNAKDHDHSLQSNPTIYIHSNINPEVSNNQWGSFAHDQEDFIIATGVATGTGTAPTTDRNAIVLKGTGGVLLGSDGGATNYMGVASDGEVTLHGTARVANNLWIPASGLKAPGTKPATYVEHGLAGAWQFTNAIEANQESISGTMRVPNRMDRGVAPSFYIGWSADGASPGNCKWQLEYLWTSPDENTTAAAQATLTVVSAASGSANGLVIATITGLAVPSATDACLHFKITRLSADAQDTIADTVELSGVCQPFTSCRLGTAT